MHRFDDPTALNGWETTWILVFGFLFLLMVRC